MGRLTLTVNASVFSIVLCLLFADSVYSQVETQVIGDSVRIHSNSGQGELILENSTKDINGFLYNRGNGRTEFRKAGQKISNDQYVIGNDTIDLGGHTGPANVYFVSRKFTGPGAAIITGLGQNNITSTNFSYSIQLAKAIPGSIKYSYPDPFSARNAALDALASGAIQEASIVIMPGNIYTVGSDNPLQNGDTSYHPNSNFISDIGFSSVNAAKVASLGQHKVNYFFDAGSELHYVNSAYTLWMTYQADTASRWISEIKGYSKMKQYYGKAQGFPSGFCYIENPFASFGFDADFIQLQYYQGFYFDDIHRYSLRIKEILSGYGIILFSGWKRDGDGTMAEGYFECEKLTYGLEKIPNDFDDHFSGLTFGQEHSSTINGERMNSSRKKNVVVNIKNANLNIHCTEYDNFISTRRTLWNAAINVKINNLQQTSAPGGKNSQFGSLVGTSFSGMYNVIFNVSIDNAITEYPLFGLTKNSYGTPAKPSYFNYHCSYHLKKPSAVDTSDWAKRNINIMNDYVSNIVTAKMVISGTYINQSNSEVLSMDYTHLSKNTELKGYFMTKAIGKPVMILNGYQDKRLAITDATLINDGTTECIALRGSQQNYQTFGGIPLNSTRTIYCKNVHSNSNPAPNVTIVGDPLKVVADINSYY